MRILSVWGEVARLLEHAVRVCHQGYNPQHYWDQAVAFYTGSLETATGADEEDNDIGYLLHQLADDFCIQFNACGEDGTERQGLSYVNHNVFKRFHETTQYFRKRQCDNIQQQSKAVLEWMTVPLIQGVLKYAYLRSVGPDTDILNAAGATYAAALLPLLHACSPSDAKLLHEYTEVGGNKVVDFAVVKDALEQNYGCLGVTCVAVGGFYDTEQYKYYDGTIPCYDPTANPTNPGDTYAPSQAPATSTLEGGRLRIDLRNMSDNNDLAIVIGSLAGVVALVCCILCGLCCAVKRNTEVDPALSGDAGEFHRGHETVSFVFS